MPQVDKDKNLSQKLRSNAPLFWKFVAEKIPLQFNYWKSYQGMIMGDSHEGNFVIDRRNSPLFKLDYINGDRDDAGQTRAHWVACGASNLTDDESRISHEAIAHGTFSDIRTTG